MSTGAPGPRRPWLALALTVPMPTIGALAAFQIWPGDVGTGVYMAVKAWAMTLPLWWVLWVDRGAWSWSPPKRGGFGLAALLGLLMGGAVWGAYAIAGDWLIDIEALRGVIEQAGLLSKPRYIGMAIFLTTLNSVMEEYLFRWFMYQQFASRLPKGAAILAAAAAFTVHHSVVLYVQFGTGVAVLGTIGCFVAAAIWSWLYARTESVWPCWLSHAIVDAALFALGWVLLFT